MINGLQTRVIDLIDFHLDEERFVLELLDEEGDAVVGIESYLVNLHEMYVLKI